MIRGVHTLLWGTRPAGVSRRHAPTPRHARLQVEALEERCLLSWGSIPPATIPVPAAAVAVSLNTQGTAAITANEVDYYQFKIAAGAPAATYVFTATAPLGSLDTVVGVYDGAGVRVAFNDDISSVNFGSRVITFLPADPAVDRTYYFGITNLAGTPGGTYTWSVDGPGDTFENNDTLADAWDLGTQTQFFQVAPAMSDGHDWFRFTMTGAGTSADYVNLKTFEPGNLDLALTDAAGVVLRSSATAAGTETVSLDGLAAGTYYVHITGADNPLYFLEIEPGTPPVSPMTLNASGSATAAGIAKRAGDTPVPDVITFQATVTGRVSILMRADVRLMQSLLSDPRQLSPSPATIPIANQTAVVGQFDGTRDYLIQFDVVAGRTYQFSASVSEPGMPHVGDYRLFLSTEPLGSDVSATTPTFVPLDASGSALRLGTLETAGDVDLFAFTATVTGRTTVRVDGGAGAGQVVHILTTPGQTYAIQVFDQNNRPGVYALSITSIADDFPDSTVFPVVLDATGAGDLKGRINYAGDEDVFTFTATQTGVMTMMMQGRPGVDSLSALMASLSVSAPLTYEAAPIHRHTAAAIARDRIVQFNVVQGQQYTVRASGAAGSSGDYLLSFAMAVDDSAGLPRNVDLSKPVGPLGGEVATVSGSIEVKTDEDLFQFTADFDGFVIVALDPTLGTSMQGLLATPTMPPVVGTQSGPGWSFVHFGAPPNSVLFQAFSAVGWQEETRAAFLGFAVKKGSTYQFLVSGNQTSIGEYTLTFSKYVAPEGAVGYGFGTTLFTNSATLIEGGVSTNTRKFTFALNSLLAPGVAVNNQGIAPKPETGITPGATNTRLAVFSLPSANPGTTMVTVPSGPATVAPNTLIASLLIVAARDNAVRPVEDVVVAQGADAVSTFLTSLLIGVIGSTTGGDAADTATVVGGTVFADQNANGRLNAGEPGVPGEKVVLEAWRDGRYVEVATAITDDQGAYSFGTVAAGEYRVRRLVKPGTQSTTPTSFEIKVINDGKPKTLNFGKPMLPGQTLVPAASTTYLAAALGDCDPAENATLDKPGPAVLDAPEDDRAAPDGSLLWLLPAALLGIAAHRREGRARCPRERGGEA